MARFARLVCIVAGVVNVAGGQVVRTVVTLRGVAFDSLHGRPLRDAFVSLGAARSTISDSLGRFTFDLVAAGTHRVTLQHDVLDSLGLSGITAQVSVTGDRDSIRIAVPSFATLWRRACGTVAPARDSGFVFGVVRDATTRRPLANAAVVGSWVETSVDGKKGVKQRQWRLDTRSDETGNFALCGLPTMTGSRLDASTDSAATGLVDVLLTDDWRIQRRDLSLARLADSAARGTVIGLVRGDGRPLADVRVSVDGSDGVRSGADGRFILRGVAAGTRQLDISAIGLAPTTAVVDVVANDTVHVTVTMGKVTLLDSMKVIAEASARTRLVTQYLDRRRVGVGYFKDSTEIGKFNTLQGVFGDMASVELQMVCGKYGMEPRFTIGSRCGNPALWLDRVQVEPVDLTSLRPQDIAAIEVYKIGDTPPEFRVKSILTGSGKNRSILPRCAVIIWTKRGWP